MLAKLVSNSQISRIGARRGTRRRLSQPPTATRQHQRLLTIRPIPRLHLLSQRRHRINTLNTLLERILSRRHILSRHNNSLRPIQIQLPQHKPQKPPGLTILPRHQNNNLLKPETSPSLILLKSMNIEPPLPRQKPPPHNRLQKITTLKTPRRLRRQLPQRRRKQPRLSTPQTLRPHRYAPRLDRISANSSTAAAASPETPTRRDSGVNRIDSNDRCKCAPNHNPLTPSESITRAYSNANLITPASTPESHSAAP